MEIAGRGRGDTDGKQGRKREQPLATEERPNDQTKHLSTAVSLAGIERPPNLSLGKKYGVIRNILTPIFYTR